MTMTLGCSSLGLPLMGPGALPPDEVLDAVFAQGGYELLELHLTEPLASPGPGSRVLCRDVTCAVERIANGVRARGGAVLLGLGGRHLLGPCRHEPSLISPDSAGRERRRRLIEEGLALAADIGAGALIFLGGPSPLAADLRKHQAREWRWLEEGIEQLLGQAEARRVVLAPEAHSRHLFADVADLRRLKERFPSPFLGFTADTVHQSITEPRPLREVYRELGPWITHVQLDNTSTSPSERGGALRHVLLDSAEGRVDLAGAVAGLGEGGYAGALCLEFLRDDFPEVDPVAYCVRIGGWLRARLGLWAGSARAERGGRPAPGGAS